MLTNCQYLYPPPSPAPDLSSIQKGVRTDGRSGKELRPIAIKTGIAAEASGSAFVRIGNTQVICSIHGPRATQRTGGDFSDTHGRIYFYYYHLYNTLSDYYI
jgi:polyribonucleotide nucleotidyltransferase